MTGQELFLKALDICGLRKTDADLPTDISDLIQRAPALINILLAECSSLDCRIRKTEHKVIGITDMNSEIDCCDIVAEAVLPYGLARLLIMGEDDALKAELERHYAEAKDIALKFGKAKVEAIAEVYE